MQEQTTLKKTLIVIGAIILILLAIWGIRVFVNQGHLSALTIVFF
jgi:hypothetical protein